MRHFRQISGPRVFTDDVTIQMEGHTGCGSDIDVEVEFRAWPDQWDASVGQGDAGDREIISIRPFYHKHAVIDGETMPYCVSERTYFDLPPRMVEHLKECIDLDKLDADWSE